MLIIVIRKKEVGDEIWQRYCPNVLFVVKRQYAGLRMECLLSESSFVADVKRKSLLQTVKKNNIRIWWKD